MPELRAVLIAIGVGLGIAAFTILWWHWPLAVGAGAGILLGGLALTGATSVRSDVDPADAAWRAAAPDLQEPPAGPSPGVAVSRGGEVDPRLDAGAGGATDLRGVAIAPTSADGGAAPARARDVPSGD